MSQPTSPKSNILQTLLFMSMLFLGYNLFLNRGGAADKRTPDQIMQAVVASADTIKSTAAKEHKPINQVVMQLESAGGLEVQEQHPSFSADQLLAQMRLQNALLLDTSIAATEQLYENKVKETYPPSQQDARMLEGRILQADTQLKAAQQRQEIQRITPAQDLMTRTGRTFDSKPVWTQPFAVSPTKEFPLTVVSAKDLSAEVENVASHLGKETLVWSFFPGYQLVDFLVHITGAQPAFSYALACLLLAVGVRTLIFPLSQRQMMWSRQMSQLAPLVNEIKEEYKAKPDKTKTDQQASAQQQTEMNARVMNLYKEYGINPMAGCAPALLQMPLFLIVYQSMLHYRFEFQKGTFLWINHAVGTASNGFIARNLGEKDYILIVIYGISMLITSMLTPISDPANAKQQRMMGVSMSLMFAVMMFFWPVPSAFVLYWVFTNILTTAQSLRAYRLPLPPLVKKNAVNGGVLPKNGSASNGSLNGKSKSTGTPQRFKPKKKK
jgi:YidC/Oxa1 family membrane protein insertase